MGVNMKRWQVGVAGIAIGFLCAAAVQAEDTRITVRVLSKDAKFIGTSIGGVRVILKDADTGEILADGITTGGTGDTGRIMKEDRKRHQPIATEGSAAFTARLDLDKPRRIEVTAYGPLGQLQSANRVSATQWVIPGRHIDQGDAWLLVMPGFAVDILAPAALARFQGIPLAVTIEANVVMM